MSGDDADDDTDGWEEAGEFTSADPSDVEPTDDDREPTETVVEPDVIDVESSETTEHGNPDDPFEELKSEYSSETPASRESQDLFEEAEGDQPADPIERVEADQNDTANAVDQDHTANAVDQNDTASTASGFGTDSAETAATGASSTADEFEADQPADPVETAATDQAGTDQTDADRHAGAVDSHQSHSPDALGPASDSPDTDAESDVFDELDAEQPAAGDAPDAEEIFDEMDVSEVDGEALWDELAGLASQADDTVAVTAEPTVEGPDVGEPLGGGSLGSGSVAAGADSDEAVVDKRQYCQQCPYFSDPPDVACSHEGTSIVEVLIDGQFRLRGCPVVTDSGPDRTILEDGS